MVQQGHVRVPAEHLFLCRTLLFLVLWVPHFSHVFFLDKRRHFNNRRSTEPSQNKRKECSNLIVALAEKSSSKICSRCYSVQYNHKWKDHKGKDKQKHEAHKSFQSLFFHLENRLYIFKGVAKKCKQLFCKDLFNCTKFPEYVDRLSEDIYQVD